MNQKLEDFGLIKINGPGAQKFLQGQLTTNVEKLSPNQYLLSAHCNPQGRVISLFHLINYNDCYYFFLPKDLIQTTINALKKYTVFYKLSMIEDSHDMHNSELFKILQHCHNEIISLNLPIIYAATSGKFLPHELNLPSFNAIDFNKGCYTGQEIIARMHYRGKSKSSLYKYSINAADIEIGSDIYLNDKACGTIVNIWHTQYATFALCIMNEKYYQQTDFVIQNKKTHMQLIPHNETNR